MDRPYVEELHIENYGCIRDATLRLTPLHALIGPNDSGKSTVLRALRTVVYLVSNEDDKDLRLSLLRALPSDDPENGSLFAISTRGLRLADRYSRSGAQFAHDWSQPVPAQVVQALKGAQLLRLDPDALRAPRPLIPDGQPLRFEDERGTGLPALYDAILSRDIQAFLQLNAEVSRLFLDVKSINLTNPSPTTKAMGVKLADGTFVPAELMSEGLLYYLAFAALKYMEPTAMLLIEEPENGLHPARIAEVMRILREVSETMQV
ncbi:MAG TPA: AAA family ATPase, partial [Candidatus Nanopelagicales bacterium]|nr:AAA family ATPase [Candidatus Nanopelagicales bacterium]